VVDEPVELELVLRVGRLLVVAGALDVVASVDGGDMLKVLEVEVVTVVAMGDGTVEAEGSVDEVPPSNGAVEEDVSAALSHGVVEVEATSVVLALEIGELDDVDGMIRGPGTYPSRCGAKGHAALFAMCSKLPASPAKPGTGVKDQVVRSPVT
jgi:hypothetical protein